MILLIVEKRLPDIIDRIEREHGRVVIRLVISTRRNPAAVILSLDDLESLGETLAVLSHPDLPAVIRDAEADSAEEPTQQPTNDQGLRLVK